MNKDFEKQMHRAIEGFTAKWYNTENVPFRFDNIYSKAQQKQRYLSFKGQIDEGLTSLSPTFSAADLTDEMVQKGIRTASEFLQIDEAVCRSLMSREYAQVTEAFIGQTRTLFPEMDSQSIFQALRNVWIMVSIQILLGKPVKLTPSLFAYSMLYPLTDNLLDDPKLSREDKQRFNDRFTRRLSGETVTSESLYEDRVYLMVEMIEGEYNRARYPKVFESLLLIQKGQVMSMHQQGAKSPFETPLLNITFFKGGASVLADGYLVAGELETEMAEFLIGYGIFLQLADDLQDAMEDHKNGHMTVFSYSIRNKQIMAMLTNRFCQFMKGILATAPKSLNTEQQAVLRLIEKSCTYLVFDAIYAQKHLFERELIRSLDQGHVLGFHFHKALKKHVTQQMKRFKNPGKMDWESVDNLILLSQRISEKPEKRLPSTT